MKNSNRGKFGLWLVLIAFIAILAMLTVLYSIEMRNPEIPSVDAELSSPTKPLTDYVYLIIVDGLRADSMDKMPFVSELASRGSFGIMAVEEPTYSRPAYSRIITGASSSINGINSNFQTRRLTIPTIYDIAASKGLKTGASAYFWFYEIAVEIPYRTGGDHENRSFGDEALPVQYAYYYDDNGYVYDDEEIFAQGKKIMLENSPNFLIVHSMEVDQMGHDHRVSDEYWDAVKRNDEYISDFVNAIPNPEESIVIVTGDHGHIDRGGHGGPEKEAVEVPFIIYGKDVLIKDHKGYRQLDIAPTICALLGLPFSAYMEGNIMDTPFNWPQEEKENKEKLLTEIHTPFVASMYDRFDILIKESDGGSIAELNKFIHERTINFRILLALIIGVISLIIAITVSKLYKMDVLKERFQGNAPVFASSILATAIYIIAYQVSMRLLHLDYSYSIIEANAGFILRLTLTPLIAFIFFFLSYKIFTGKKNKPDIYELHIKLLVKTMLLGIVIAAVLMNGNEIFLPDFRWYLVFAFTCYHLFLTAIMALIFRRFSNAN